MGDGTESNPFTREDVIAQIRARGRPQGLDLSGKCFETGINLRNLNLRGIILDGVDLSGSYPPPGGAGDAFFIIESPETRGAHLERANLIDASLKGAMLSEVHFEGADLSHAHLEHACLWHAHLKETDMVDSHLNGADLKNADLTGARLIHAHLCDADLFEACLTGAVLDQAHLERARFGSANLEGAYLAYANLQGAFLMNADLRGADLTAVINAVEACWEDARFDSDTKLGSVDWGNHILPEERRGEESKGEKRGSWLTSAANNYRRLRTWYNEQGMYDIAGEFFYREMEARRKALGWREKPHLKLWNWVVRLLCGYGERPLRAILSGIVILFGFALVYFFARGVAPYDFTAQAFSRSLYCSAASFTALGYGPWVDTASVRSWVSGVGVTETFIGVFMMALFLVTFTRKMSR